MAATLWFATGACTLTPPGPWVSFQVQVDSRAAPAGLAQMDCFFASVKGQGIVGSAIPGEAAKVAACLDFGILSPLVSPGIVATAGATLRVPAGRGREITVLGVKSPPGISCATKKFIFDYVGGPKPEIYKIARTTADLFVSSRVEVKSAYDPTTARDILADCIASEGVNPDPPPDPPAVVLAPATAITRLGGSLVFNVSGGTSPFSVQEILGFGTIVVLNATQFRYDAPTNPAGGGAASVKVTDAANAQDLSPVEVRPKLVLVPAPQALAFRSSQAFSATSPAPVGTLVFSVVAGDPGAFTANVYKRPWSSGTVTLEVNDDLGVKTSGTYSLAPTALQIGGENAVAAASTTPAAGVFAVKGGNLIVGGKTQATFFGPAGVLTALGTSPSEEFGFLGAYDAGFGAARWMVTLGTGSSSDAAEVGAIATGTVDGALRLCAGGKVENKKLAGFGSVDGVPDVFVGCWNPTVSGAGTPLWLRQLRTSSTTTAPNTSLATGRPLALDPTGDAYVLGYSLAVNAAGGGDPLQSAGVPFSEVPAFSQSVSAHTLFAAKLASAGGGLLWGTQIWDLGGTGLTPIAIERFGNDGAGNAQTVLGLAFLDGSVLSGGGIPQLDVTNSSAGFPSQNVVLATFNAATGALVKFKLVGTSTPPQVTVPLALRVSDAAYVLARGTTAPSGFATTAGANPFAGQELMAMRLDGMTGALDWGRLVQVTGSGASPTFTPAGFTQDATAVYACGVLGGGQAFGGSPGAAGKKFFVARFAKSDGTLSVGYFGSSAGSTAAVSGCVAHTVGGVPKLTLYGEYAGGAIPARSATSLGTGTQALVVARVDPVSTPPSVEWVVQLSPLAVHPASIPVDTDDALPRAMSVSATGDVTVLGSAIGPMPAPPLGATAVPLFGMATYPTGMGSLVVLRVSTAGAYQWGLQVTKGGTSPTPLALTEDQGFIYAYGKLDGDLGGQHDGTGAPDALVLKINSSGAIQ